MNTLSKIVTGNATRTTERKPHFTFHLKQHLLHHLHIHRISDKPDDKLNPVMVHVYIDWE